MRSAFNESFSSLSRIGGVIFKSLKTWMRSDIPYLVFWIRKDSGNLRKGLDKKVKSPQDLDELLLLFYCHLRKLSVVHSNGRNEPKISIFKSLKTWMRSGHPDQWDPARHSEARRQPARHSRRAQHVFVVKIRHLLSKRSPRWPVLMPPSDSHSCQRSAGKNLQTLVA
jgi:hypothetical protein